MKFFTADRKQSLKKSQISLTKFNDIKPVSLQKIVDEWFPNGVSKHGDTFFLDGKSSMDTKNSQIEIIFELIRRIEYPNNKSRFETCIFATKTLKNAKKFAKSFGGNPNAPVWEVECSDYFKGDMNLLTTQGSLLQMIENSRKYWEGKVGVNTPYWEYLLFSPVEILKKVA